MMAGEVGDLASNIKKNYKNYDTKFLNREKWWRNFFRPDDDI